MRRGRGSLAEGVAAALLFLAFLAQGFTALERNSLTCDEHAFQPAGYVCWMERVFFRPVPEHPPLSSLVASAPLLEDHLPRDVIAGSVLLVEVPIGELPPAPAPLEPRDLRAIDGSLLPLHLVYPDESGREVRHGACTIFHPGGGRREEGGMAHGPLHGPSSRRRPGDELEEAGTMWQGKMHGVIGPLMNPAPGRTCGSTGPAGVSMRRPAREATES